jgi:hypothetical protein
MTTLPAKKFAAVIAAAKASIPTHGHISATLSAPPIILADVSSSMGDHVGGGRTKSELLGEALEYLCVKREYIIYAFSHVPKRVVAGGRLPQPGGTTALHLALDEVRGVVAPSVLVISDGEPDSEAAALAAAAKIKAPISTLFIGDDNNQKAKRFLRRLATASGGQSAEHDVRALGGAMLPAKISQLALPSPARQG